MRESQSLRLNDLLRCSPELYPIVREAVKVLLSDGTRGNSDLAILEQNFARDPYATLKPDMEVNGPDDDPDQEEEEDEDEDDSDSEDGE